MIQLGLRKRFGEPASKMTPISGVTGKFSKQPLKCVQVVLALLLFFVISEFFLQKQLNTTTVSSCSQSPFMELPRGDQAGSIPIQFPKSPTVHDAFDDHNVVHWDDLTELAPKGLRTSIDTSGSHEVRSLSYGLSPVKNICIHPSGKILVVGVSESEFARSLSEAGEIMVTEWEESYNCTVGCKGATFLDKTPENALWMSGITTHIIPYITNPIHNFGERVWPLLAGLRDPLDEDKTARRNFYVHRMHQWLDQAHHNLDRNTFMFQIALLSRMASPGRIKFLQHSEDETRPVCFERLMIAFSRGGRMSTKLGLEKFGAALARYRHGAFEFFGISNPKVSLPPRRLRVALYGRGDATRRRVANLPEVIQYLRSSVNPPVDLTIIDKLLESGVYNQTLPEVVSLMAQTDVLVTAHGAATWATAFMPERSAVLEICGPCGPGSWISKTIAPSLALKHRLERMWGEPVASPLAGNTTECVSVRETPDFTVDMGRLRDEIQSLRAADGPGDRLPLHWLFNWSSNSY